MKRIDLWFGLGGIALLTACAPGVQQSNHQNLDFAECKRLADETFRSGKLNYNLCPGYMPDGQPNEIF